MSHGRPVSRLTSVLPSGVEVGRARSDRALVVGGGHVGRTVASHLSDDYDVTFVSRNRQVVERTTCDDVTAHHVEEIDANALAEADADDVSLAVAASADDGVNFLASQLLRATFGADTVVIRVDDRENLDTFDDLDIETVCVPELLVEEMSSQLESVADDVAEL